MIFFYGLSDGLEERRFPGSRRRDDQAALALADRRQEVHDPGVHVLGIPILEVDLLERIKRRQALEMDVPPLVLDDMGMGEVDGLDLDQGEVFLAVLGGSDDAADR